MQQNSVKHSKNRNIIFNNKYDKTKYYLKKIELKRNEKSMLKLFSISFVYNPILAHNPSSSGEQWSISTLQTGHHHAINIIQYECFSGIFICWNRAEHFAHVLWKPLIQFNDQF